MILWRVFPADPSARSHAPGGPLWFARERQGFGRHDQPRVYGCMYTALESVSAVAERIEHFRGAGPVAPEMLTHRGHPLSLVALELPDVAELVDLDDPTVLIREGLRPSRVATYERAETQRHALRLFETHRRAAGLRWWSTIEGSWTNVTVFSRAARRLKVLEVTPLYIDHPSVVKAAQALRI